MLPAASRSRLGRKPQYSLVAAILEWRSKKAGRGRIGTEREREIRSRETEDEILYNESAIGARLLAADRDLAAGAAQ
jgi:hypothetical protein